MWNNPNDPMPIKTLNNNGLKVLEEVPGEYAIYIDKDAVFTTVQKYAPGSYQTFMERKADVDNSRSLLRGYNIEWTQQDDSDLFIQCNNEALQKLENQPMMLPVDGEGEVQPAVLEPKTVPTTYECCFRVGNEGVYVGEGYENLFPIEHFFDYGNGYFYKSLKNPNFNYNVLKTITNISGIRYYVMYEEVLNIGTNDLKVHINNGTLPITTIVPNSKINSYGGMITTVPGAVFQVRFDALESNTEIKLDIKNPIISKTSTPKPFVKSIMPSGKLDRISNANETTHTFLNKGDGVITFGNGYFSLKGEKIQQLLVYNALLTEQEKQAELAKDIKLATNNTQMHTQI